MEVITPMPATDFHFDSTCSSPFISAPSSPKAFGNYSYYSAPTSPSRASSIYMDASRMPFEWEEEDRPKSTQNEEDDDEEEEDYDFAFNFSGQLEMTSLTAAEELFDHGKIRPLKPPPRLQLVDGQDIRKTSPVSSPKSPNIFRNAFKRRDVDPFAAAIEESRKGSERERGRERAAAPTSGSNRRGARSLSPLRAPDSKPSSASSTLSSLKGSGKKWRLRDFLLFRSASEGRATEKETLRKYGVLPKKVGEDVKNSSFRSTDSGGSVSGSRKGGPVSAHELIYTSNRAVSEEMRRKTFLPYKQGLFGCVGFNPTVHGLAKGYDSFRRV